MRAFAATDSQARLVTHDELEKRLGDGELRILDTRPKADYDKGHIPGAVWVDAKAVEEMAAKPGALADRGAWETWLAPLGIGQSLRLPPSLRQPTAARRSECGRRPEAAGT